MQNGTSKQNEKFSKNEKKYINEAKKYLTMTYWQGQKKSSSDIVVTNRYFAFTYMRHEQSP